MVGCESKKPQDLIDSTHQRRLHRQIRTLIDQVDVPTLLIRHSLPDFNSLENLDVMFNLVCLQQLGVLVLPCPEDSQLALTYLSKYRTVLNTESRTPLSAIRGSDSERKADDSDSLLRKIRGVGPQLEQRLLSKFDSPLAVLSSSHENLVEAGASSRVATRIKELANGS